MDIEKEIIERLRTEYNSGATYQQMSKTHNVSVQHIRALMVGSRSVNCMTLDTLRKLFPRVKIILDPGPGDDTHSAPADTGAPMLGTVIEAVMSAADLDPAAKVRLYEIIRQVQRRPRRREAAV